MFSLLSVASKEVWHTKQWNHVFDSQLNRLSSQRTKYASVNIVYLIVISFGIKNKHCSSFEGSITYPKSVDFIFEYVCLLQSFL